MGTFIRWTSLSVLLLCSTSLLLADASSDDTVLADAVSSYAEEIFARYPSTQLYLAGDTVAFYGTPMSSGATPAAAVGHWLDEFGFSFGIEGCELKLQRSNVVGHGSLTVFAYVQTLHGHPVEGSVARIVTRHHDGEHAVVHVAARLSPPPPSGFAPVVVGPEEAVMAVQFLGEYADLTDWGEASLVALRESGATHLVWKLSGHHADMSRQRAFTFFVSAETGVLIDARSEIYHVDVEGVIAANITPGMLPDVPYNPPMIFPLFGGHASIVNFHGYADADGAYVVPNPGAGPVTVRADLEGEFIFIVDALGQPIFQDQDVTPPGPADFLLNIAPSEFSTSQVNAMFHGRGVYEFYKTRQPAYEELDIPLQTNVNLDQNCNAFFSPAEPSINFFTAGGGCPNTAYTTVVYHEYGHFIVDTLGLEQGAFGEGFSDVIAVLAFDTPLLGEDFFGVNTVVRDVDTTDLLFPCGGGGVHFCGMLLGGCWWDMKLGLQAALGADVGLEYTQQLFTDWSQITLGGQGANSAHALTAIEVLLADDDNADITDGTPNIITICDAFAEHGIDCPNVSLSFEYPNGVPSTAVPGEATSFLVNVVDIQGTAQPGSGMLFVSVDGAPFAGGPMTELAPNQYEATLPAVDCGSAIRFYVTAVDDLGTPQSSPPLAPQITYVTRADCLFLANVTGFLGQTNLTVPVGGGSSTFLSGFSASVAYESDLLDATDFNIDGTLPGDLGAEFILPQLDDAAGSATLQVIMDQPPLDSIFLIPGTDLHFANLVFSVNGPVTDGETRELTFVDGLGTVPVDNEFVDSTGFSYPPATLGSTVTFFNQPSFIRGDCDGSTLIQLPDAILMLNTLFAGAAPPDCLKACDFSDSGTLDLEDGIGILFYVFAGGAPPPPPFPDPGPDPTPDSLPCF